MIGKLIVIISLVGLLIVSAVIVSSLPPMKQITVKSKITEKYTKIVDDAPYLYPDSGGIGSLPINPETGMPGTALGEHTDYYFKLEDGKKVKVSKNVFDKYNVGDIYSYSKWIVDENE